MIITKNNLFKALLVAVFFAANLSVAQQQNTYDFLKLNVDARSSAMAGSFVSMENDVNAIFYNPCWSRHPVKQTGKRWLLQVPYGY